MTDPTSLLASKDARIAELERSRDDLVREQSRLATVAQEWVAKAKAAEQSALTAKRDGMIEAAGIVAGQVYKERFRTWAFRGGNRSEESEIVRFADDAAYAIRARAASLTGEGAGGWLQKQIDHAKQNVAAWPEWKRDGSTLK